MPFPRGHLFVEGQYARVLTNVLGEVYYGIGDSGVPFAASGKTCGFRLVGGLAFRLGGD